MPVWRALLDGGLNCHPRHLLILGVSTFRQYSRYFDPSDYLLQARMPRIKGSSLFRRKRPTYESCRVLAKFQEYCEIPFYRRLNEPLAFKSTLVLKGTVAIDALAFTVNFCYTNNKGERILAFHFNPRFEQNYVARNSRIDGAWGEEESHSLRKNPFRRGKKFTLELFNNRNCFMVGVDGMHFCDYSHRLPPTSITNVEIFGDVNLDCVELTSFDSYPSTPLSNITNFPQEAPIMYSLKENLGVGSAIVITGRVKLLASCFYINLQDSHLYWPHPQVPFHMSFRFYEYTLQPHVVVFNSWKDTGWEEETSTNLKGRLMPGSKFSIVITITGLGYFVQIEDVPFPVFKHRTDPSNIKSVYVQGDAIIHSIKLI